MNSKLYYGCAMRGRYINNKTQQQLECNGLEISNAITTVQKDSLIMVIEIDEDIQFGKTKE